MRSVRLQRASRTGMSARARRRTRRTGFRPLVAVEAPGQFSFLSRLCGGRSVHAVHYLRESIDMLFDITEVDVGFDNGAIQANLTVSGQFLPGESAKVPAWASILGLWEGGAVSLRRYARYATHSANF